MADGRFFDDDGMDFAVYCVLSGVRYGMAEVGEVVALRDRIIDGDAESWISAWTALGRRVAEIGDAAAAAGRTTSARGAHLRAANYLACGNFWVGDDRERFEANWRRHRRAWDAAVDRWPTPASEVSVPFDGTALPGYWFTPPSGAAERTVLLVGGLDAPISDATMTGLCDGVDRDWNVLCVECPGQGAAFFDGGLAVRPDAQAPLGAALDWLDARVPDGAIALMGVNHGALFVARAAAHHRGRVQALVLDPGVAELTADDVAPVNQWQRPPEDALAAYRLSDDEVAGIACPTYVADPADAMGYVGQPAVIAERLRRARADAGAEVHHDRFTAAEGAARDCEIGAPQVRNQRVYDWLDARIAPARVAT